MRHSLKCYICGKFIRAADAEFQYTLRHVTPEDYYIPDGEAYHLACMEQFKQEVNDG